MKNIYNDNSFIVSDDISERIDMSSIMDSEKTIDQFFCILDLDSENIRSTLNSIAYFRKSEDMLIYKVDLNMDSQSTEKIFNQEKISKLSIKNNNSILIELLGDLELKSIKLIPGTSGFHNVSLTISACGS
mgnify:CR=1 FL=1